MGECLSAQSARVVYYELKYELKDFSAALFYAFALNTVYPAGLAGGHCVKICFRKTCGSRALMIRPRPFKRDDEKHSSPFANCGIVSFMDASIPSSMPDSDNSSDADRRRICGFDLADALNQSLARRATSIREDKRSGLGMVRQDH